MGTGDGEREIQRGESQTMFTEREGIRRKRMTMRAHYDHDAAGDHQAKADERGDSLLVGRQSHEKEEKKRKERRGIRGEVIISLRPCHQRHRHHHHRQVTSL